MANNESQNGMDATVTPQEAEILREASQTMEAVAEAEREADILRDAAQAMETVAQADHEAELLRDAAAQMQAAAEEEELTQLRDEAFDAVLARHQRAQREAARQAETPREVVITHPMNCQLPPPPSGRKAKSVSYAKWGYIFLLPFFVTFAIFTIIPLARTFYESLFEHYWAQGGLNEVGPTFIGLENFVTIFAKENLGKFMMNTMIMWIMGFIPQIIVSLALAVWFTDRNMRIRFQPFFKTVIYMPNLIMASAFAMLFFVLFSDGGPINGALQALGMEPVEWTRNMWGNRILVAMMNFMMWFGNTTIVLMAAVMGIDQSLFEAADIDGANGWQAFTRVTMPLIRPVLSYTLITSLIGGLQMFDVPQVLTNGGNVADRSCMTIIMLLNNYIGKSKNYGYGGALSVLLFLVTAALGLLVYYSLNTNEREAKKLAKEQKRKMAQMRQGGELA